MVGSFPLRICLSTRKYTSYTIIPAICIKEKLLRSHISRFFMSCHQCGRVFCSYSVISRMKTTARGHFFWKSQLRDQLDKVPSWLNRNSYSPLNFHFYSNFISEWSVFSENCYVGGLIMTLWEKLKKKTTKKQKTWDSWQNCESLKEWKCSMLFTTFSALVPYIFISLVPMKWVAVWVS